MIATPTSLAAIAEEMERRSELCRKAFGIANDIGLEGDADPGGWRTAAAVWSEAATLVRNATLTTENEHGK